MGGVAHAVERPSLVPLGGGLFMVLTGAINVARRYRPVPSCSTVPHHWAAASRLP